MICISVKSEIEIAVRNNPILFPLPTKVVLYIIVMYDSESLVFTRVYSWLFGATPVCDDQGQISIVGVSTDDELLNV